MNKSLKELALLVGGKIKGDEHIIIKGVAKVEDVKEGEITFAVSGKFLSLAEKSKASAVIIPQEVENFSKPVIQTANPRLAFARVLEIFAPLAPEFKGIHPSAIISEGVKIGRGATIGPLCIIQEGAKIGDNAYISGFSYLGRDVSVGERTFLHPRVTVLDKTSIGKKVIIHSGAIIGSDGFGFVKTEDSSYYKIPQIGRVVIEDAVEIGANVTIDRATTGETRIGRGTKIDNLVHIAHNVTVGKNVAIVALVGISGSSCVGDGAVLAGQVGISDHVSIGANSIVGAKSGITKDIPANSFVWGIPARDHLVQKKITAVVHRLPELLKRVQKLEKLIKEE
ncbi:UDP-3-O-(3-hydroxymyristoyl)glucosamine N-acyltransferase [Candidatus Aerophobetes bacterium]|nr:UDP-3-O-(3-hydroxymyristoyl)glucosamine N-acyltransferase [Candidatus Aerophobetes bacterium]